MNTLWAQIREDLDNPRTRRFRITSLILGFGLAAVLAALRTLSAGGDTAFDALEAVGYDLRMGRRGEIVESPAITNVDIDDISIDYVGRWPWERLRHAQLVEALHEMGAHSVVFDVEFFSPQQPQFNEEQFNTTALRKKFGLQFADVRDYLRRFNSPDEEERRAALDELGVLIARDEVKTKFGDKARLLANLEYEFYETVDAMKRDNDALFAAGLARAAGTAPAETRAGTGARPYGAAAFRLAAAEPVEAAGEPGAEAGRPTAIFLPFHFDVSMNLPLAMVSLEVAADKRPGAAAVGAYEVMERVLYERPAATVLDVAAAVRAAALEHPAWTRIIQRKTEQTPDAYFRDIIEYHYSGVRKARILDRAFDALKAALAAARQAAPAGARLSVDDLTLAVGDVFPIGEGEGQVGRDSPLGTIFVDQFAKAQAMLRLRDEYQFRGRLDGDASAFQYHQTIEPTIDRLLAHASNSNFVSIDPDKDGILRRAILLWFHTDDAVGTARRLRRGEPPPADQSVPHLQIAFQAATHYLGIADEQITVVPGRYVRIKDGSWPVYGPGRTPGSWVEQRRVTQDEVRIPIDERGQMLINWVGGKNDGWDEHYGHVPFSSIVEYMDHEESIRKQAERLYRASALAGAAGQAVADVEPALGKELAQAAQGITVAGESAGPPPAFTAALGVQGDPWPAFFEPLIAAAERRDLTALFAGFETLDRALAAIFTRAYLNRAEYPLWATGADGVKTLRHLLRWREIMSWAETGQQPELLAEVLRAFAVPKAADDWGAVEEEEEPAEEDAPAEEEAPAEEAPAAGVAPPPPAADSSSQPGAAGPPVAPAEEEAPAAGEEEEEVLFDEGGAGLRTNYGAPLVERVTLAPEADARWRNALATLRAQADAPRADAVRAALDEAQAAWRTVYAERLFAPGPDLFSSGTRWAFWVRALTDAATLRMDLPAWQAQVAEQGREALMPAAGGGPERYDRRARLDRAVAALAAALAPLGEGAAKARELLAVYEALAKELAVQAEALRPAQPAASAPAGGAPPAVRSELVEERTEDARPSTDSGRTEEDGPSTGSERTIPDDAEAAEPPVRWEPELRAYFAALDRAAALWNDLGAELDAAARAEGVAQDAEQRLLAANADFFTVRKNFLTESISAARARFEELTMLSDGAAALREIRQRRQEILTGLKDKVDGRICVVGATFTGGTDLKPTPLHPRFPGVGLHTNVINTVLTRQFMDKVAPGADLAAFLALGLITALVASFLSVLPALGVFAFVTVGFYGVNQALFNQGLWMDLLMPTGSCFVAFLAITAYRQLTEEKAKREMQHMFGTYVSPEVVKVLARNPEKAKQGGERRDMTVMFSDVSGFTTISEALTPEALVDLLNLYLGRMTEIIMETRGTVDKYEGDAIMAFWGAPLDDPDHALNCCANALRNLEALWVLNAEELAARKLPRLDCRIGVNSGPMVAGNMGSSRKLNYTVMGDAVNQSARFEPACKEFDVRVQTSEETVRRVNGPHPGWHHPESGIPLAHPDAGGYQPERDARGLPRRYDLAARDGPPIINRAANPHPAVAPRVIFRPLARLQVKGKLIPINTFEVMCLAEQSYRPRLKDGTILDLPPDETAELCRVWQETLEFYWSGDRHVKDRPAQIKHFQEAQDRFRAILERWPHDGPSGKYLELCRQWIENELPDPWGGVHILLAK